MAQRVLLIKPPEESRFNFGAFSLGVLAAAVRDVADVRILDATRLTIAETVRRAAEAAPDWVGVTTMALGSLVPASALIRNLRTTLPRVRVVAGGHGASMLPRVPLEAGADTVVLGEGEITLRRLLVQGLSADLTGLARLADGVETRGPGAPLVRPLDALEPPARDLMPEPAGGVHLMETSRGCPHACRFCETTRFYGRRWRYLTPPRVAAEVRRLVQEHDAWIIEITDDNFAASRRRVLEICRLLQQEELPAFFMLSARADDLVANPGLLPAMAAARMLRISVGVETLDPGVARRAGKAIPLDTYRQLFERMRNLGMFSVASFITGLPGETTETRRSTVDLAEAAGPDAAQFVPFYPFPGIPLSHGRTGFDPDPVAVDDARRFTGEFYTRSSAYQRLAGAAEGEGVRALLARGTLEKYASSQTAVAG